VLVLLPRYKIPVSSSSFPVSLGDCSTSTDK
jgi:hypothetical protein